MRTCTYYLKNYSEFVLLPQKQGNHRLMKEGLFLALPVSLFPRFSLDLRVDHSRLVLCEKSK